MQTLEDMLYQMLCQYENQRGDDNDLTAKEFCAGWAEALRGLDAAQQKGDGVSLFYRKK